MRVIDYKAIRKNVEEMINALEYDSMRSAGKAKVNAANLVDLYKLKDIYKELAVDKKSAPKKAADKAAE